MPPIEPPAAETPNLQAELEKMKQQFAAQQAAFAEQQKALQASQAQLQAIHNERAEPKPAGPTLDPQLQEQLNAWANQTLKPVFDQFGAQMQQFRGFQSGNQLQQAAAKVQAPADVQKRADEILAEQHRAGRNVAPDTCLRQAWGEIAEAQHLEALKSKTVQTQFNSAPPTYSQPGHLPSYTSAVAPPRASLNSQDWLSWGEANDLPL